MAKDFARPFYDGQQWRKTRTAYLESQHYICEGCGGTACLAHHIKHISAGNVHDPNITLDWQNLMALCEQCHAEVHARDDAQRSCGAGLNGIAFDDDGNAIKAPNVHLICECVGSGRREYVQHRITDADIVVDVYGICAALTGEPSKMCCEPISALAAALEVKELLLSIIQTRRGRWKHAFVIDNSTNPAEMRRIANDLNAELVFIDSTLDSCLTRIRATVENTVVRISLEEKAREWHVEYARALGGDHPPIQP